MCFVISTHILYGVRVCTLILPPRLNRENIWYCTLTVILQHYFIKNDSEHHRIRSRKLCRTVLKILTQHTFRDAVIAKAHPVLLFQQQLLHNSQTQEKK